MFVCVLIVSLLYITEVVCDIVFALLYSENLCASHTLAYMLLLL